jgi:hypothetical protein
MSRRSGRIVLRRQAVDAAAEIGDRPFRADEPQDGEAERRLARAGFADDADRLAFAHGERNAVDRLDVPTVLRMKPRLTGNQTRRLSVCTIGFAVASAGGARLSARPRAGLRVGMLRRGENLRRRPGLDDPALSA